MTARRFGAEPRGSLNGRSVFTRFFSKLLFLNLRAFQLKQYLIKYSENLRLYSLLNYHQYEPDPGMILWKKYIAKKWKTLAVLRSNRTKCRTKPNQIATLGMPASKQHWWRSAPSNSTISGGYYLQKLQSVLQNMTKIVYKFKRIRIIPSMFKENTVVSFLKIAKTIIII